MQRRISFVFFVAVLALVLCLPRFCAAAGTRVYVCAPNRNSPPGWATRIAAALKTYRDSWLSQ